MQIIEHKLDEITLKYPLENIAPLKDILFLDIETTGFTAKNSKLYLIGCVYYKEDSFNTIQFFAEDYSDEKELLDEFFKFMKDFKVIIQFNGNNFDIPYILGKCAEFNLEYNFDTCVGIDLYKRISPYKAFLKLENCKQKTIEKFLKIDREDIYSGGDLIGIYNEYVASKDEEKLKLLLLHNFEDIKGMLEILPILSYCDLFDKKLTVTKASASTFTDSEGKNHTELLLYFDLPSQFVTPISFLKDNCYFAASKESGMLRVPIYEEEMKYFYANYKDYYYLPSEDMAVHKLVASYVDKEHRVPAKASTCYTKLASKFLPQWDALVTPFFKRDYSSKELFYELTDERKTDREMFSQYVTHVLEHMVK